MQIQPSRLMNDKTNTPSAGCVILSPSVCGRTSRHRGEALRDRVDRFGRAIGPYRCRACPSRHDEPGGQHLHQLAVALAEWTNIFQELWQAGAELLTTRLLPRHDPCGYWVGSIGDKLPHEALRRCR
jgi:hypothetical protein